MADPQDAGVGAASGVDQGRRGKFVHLHLHTEYSLLDGGNRLDKLVARVKELGMDAVAVTDHGNMHAAVSFVEKAKAAGVKPILGVEAYVAPGDRTDKRYTGVADGGYHLVLLAENEAGWRNLLYLCSEAYLTGFYFKPRMDREILERHSEGLIAINGHLGSEIAFHLLNYEQGRDESHWDKAVEAAEWHKRVFAGTDAGPGFYVELQHHVPEQIAINPHLIRLAREVGAPLVCDNDSHFLRAEDHDAHDTLICISMGKVKRDPDRLRYTPELYVKGPGEMWDLFAGDGAAGMYREAGPSGKPAGVEALENTVRIAERCNVELGTGANHAPMVRVRIPGKKELPRWDEARFGGDLTAWFKAYCAAFEVVPLEAGEGEARDAALKAAKEECDAALRALAEAGLVWRYGPGVFEAGEQNEAKRARLERELGILADKGISAYFLIVWDFVNWARQRGIPALARGSGVGTMAGYVLGLSNACPVEYGLLFERFTDPDRSEYPDIDIDLCQDGRGEVIDYVRGKYGHVAQIITFGTLKARAAVRDVARVLEVPLAEADKLAKLIPEQLGMTLDRALEEEPDLKKLYETEEWVRGVIDTARVMEGQARHASVHAAGVIVATRPLHEIVPLYKQSGADEKEVVTQWDGPTCEKMGLLKMDFLGLRTLSVIERCKKLIRETLSEAEIWKAVGRGAEWERKRAGEKGGRAGEEQEGAAARAHPLDLDRLVFDDPRVFDVFARGDTTGVFQFESAGMRRLLMEMKPDRLEDLIAANALFRPGPMDLIPDYNRRKHGQDRVPSVHEIVDRYTAGTYGVMVYQEQVMQIVHELGGIPLRAAYSLIKAISKKKAKVIDAERPKFVAGAEQKGLPRKKAEELFELILKFAGYGFNKSHSTGYAIVAYQTAYLKTYFPAAYMAAFLTYESQAQKASDWAPYLDDCRRTRTIDPATGAVVRSGIEVRPPDVNVSKAVFSVVYDDGEPRDAQHGHIRFGLGAIKGAGEKAIEAIIRERDGDAPGDGEQGAGAAGEAGAARGSGPYSSLFEFCERVPPGAVTKTTIEALVKAGAFDSVHGKAARASLLAGVEAAMRSGAQAAADRAAGQASLFGGPTVEEKKSAATNAAGDALPKVSGWRESEALAHEKDVLGLYLSSHPLKEWLPWIRAMEANSTAEFRELDEEQKKRMHARPILLGGMVQAVRAITVRNGRTAGERMAFVTIEDEAGAMDGVLFPEDFRKFEHLVVPDATLFFIGKLDLMRGEPQILIDRVMPITDMPRWPVKEVVVRFDEARLNGALEHRLMDACGVLKKWIGCAGAPGAVVHGNSVRGHAGAGGGIEPIDGPGAHMNGAENGAPNGAEAFAQVQAPAAPVRVMMKLDGFSEEVRVSVHESWKATPEPVLVDELAKLVGEGNVVVVGALQVKKPEERRGGGRYGGGG